MVSAAVRALRTRGTTEKKSDPGRRSQHQAKQQLRRDVPRALPFDSMSSPFLRVCSGQSLALHLSSSLPSAPCLCCSQPDSTCPRPSPASPAPSVCGRPRGWRFAGEPEAAHACIACIACEISSPQLRGPALRPPFFLPRGRGVVLAALGADSTRDRLDL